MFAMASVALRSPTMMCFYKNHSESTLRSASDSSYRSSRGSDDMASGSALASDEALIRLEGDVLCGVVAVILERIRLNHPRLALGTI